MPITVKIPTPLRPMVKGSAELKIEAASVRQLLDAIETDYTGFRARICDDKGELRRFVNLFLNDEDVRYIGGLDAKIKDGDVVSIVPAIAGG